MRTALIVLNGGLGNLVIAAPVLEAMERAWPQLRYHLPHNELLSAPWVHRRLQLRGRARPTVPPLWRRFRPGDVDAILWPGAAASF